MNKSLHIINIIEDAETTTLVPDHRKVSDLKASISNYSDIPGDIKRLFGSANTWTIGKVIWLKNNNSAIMLLNYDKAVYRKSGDIFIVSIKVPGQEVIKLRDKKIFTVEVENLVNNKIVKSWSGSDKKEAKQKFKRWKSRYKENSEYLVKLKNYKGIVISKYLSKPK